MKKDELSNEDDMTVELTLDDNSVVTCSVITILTVDQKDYIALLPQNQQEGNEGEVWFYGYSEDPLNEDAEPVLSFIEDDSVYEAVADAFDEFLDQCEFDEMKDES